MVVCVSEPFAVSSPQTEKNAQGGDYRSVWGRLNARRHRACSRARKASSAFSTFRWISFHANCRFEFQKRGQLFIRTHNVTLSVAAMWRRQSRSFARWNQSLRHAAHVVALGRFSNMGFLGNHGSLELSTLGDTNHVVFFEHQPVTVDVDLAFPDDPARRWHA